MTTTIEDDGLRAIERLKLWFFRDLSDEQRWKLFRLNEIPAEGNETHAVQSKMLKHVLAALRSSPAVDGVGVKPLEWKESDGGFLSRGGLFEYWVKQPINANVWRWAKWPLGAYSTPYPTADEAKAAAEAHYQDRIRSALSPTSDRESVVEACAKVITDLADEWKRRGGLPSSDGEWPAYMAKAVRRLALSKEGEAS